MCKTPVYIHGNAVGPAGPLAPTQQGPFYGLEWRNGFQPSLLLVHKAHPEHQPPLQAGPFLLLPKMGYRTAHLEQQERL